MTAAVKAKLPKILLVESMPQISRDLFFLPLCAPRRRLLVQMPIPVLLKSPPLDY
jgi:hypothetical protein